MDDDKTTTTLERMYSTELSLACYIPLLFSLFYFIPFLVHGFTWQEAVVLVIAYTIFVLLYSLCRVNEARAPLYIFLIVVIAVVVGKLNWMSYAFIWYASYYAGYLFKTPTVVLCNLLFIPCLIAIWSFTTHPLSVFLSFSFLPCVALALYGMFDKRVRLEEAAKREKNAQIEALATIAERERLTRDMHDVIGHSLTALCLKSRLALKLGHSGDTEQSLREMSEVEKIASGALSDVRKAITQYKKRSLDEQLNALITQLKDAGFSVNLNFDVEQVDAKHESHFILILTEAVTNILRHSDGNQVAITLAKDPANAILRVEDNGSQKDFRMGNGIRGIRERVEEMRGQFECFSQQGFVLQVTL